MMDSLVSHLFSTQDGVAWLVFKWVLVVLAAGFIGQFGKALASHLIGRARERRRPPARTPAPEVLSPRPAAPASETASERVPEPSRELDEKKRRKTEAKQRKKALKGLKKLFK